MGKLRREITTFYEAQLSAILATAIDFGLSYALAELAGLWYVVATFTGALTGGVVNCAVNYRWVFKAEGLRKNRVAMRYAFVWVGSIALNTLGTYLVTELSGEHFIIGKTLVAVVVAILWNYQLQRNFVFKATRQHPNEITS